MQTPSADRPRAAPDDAEPAAVALPVRIDRATLVVLAVVAVLTVANVAGVLLARRGHDLWKLVPLTDVNAEMSAPTWFSALQLTVAGALMVLIGTIPSERHRRRRWHFLALLLVLMAVDEVAAYHESWIGPARETFDASGFLFAAWVIPGMALVGLVAVSQVRFLRRLPRDTAVGLVVAAAVFLSGAVGMEMVGGKYGEDWGTDTKAYSAMVAVEELLEMVGATILVRTLLRHLERAGARFDVSFATR